MSAPGVVVFGTSFGVITHLRALRAAGFDVVGLVGRNPSKTEERARNAGVPNALTSLADALALPGVDAVSIATPPHTHAEIALASIAAGKHVLCEKPFARDLAEARQMLDAAEKAGIVHLLAAEFRYATTQAVMTRAILEGRIGEPRLATFAMQIPVLADPAGEVPAWWSDAGEGGGWLGAYAPHLIDQVRVMLGEITGVSASLQTVADRDWTAEDAFTIHFRTDRGVDGILQSTPAAWGPPLAATRIAGSRGTIYTEGADVCVADRDGVHTLDVPADLTNDAPIPPDSALITTAYDIFHAGGIDLAPFTRLAHIFHDAITGKGVPDDPAPATFHDAVANQAILDAIRRSNTEEAWITPSA